MFPVLDEESGDPIIPENTMIDEKYADLLDEKGVSSIMIRSVLTCQSEHGVCAHCYGRDLARGRLVSYNFV